jgi:hypothetical protein
LARRRGDGRDDCSFDKRGVAQLNLSISIETEHFKRGFGTENGGSEVHEDEDAVALIGFGDRSRDRLCIRAERTIGRATGRSYDDLISRHLLRDISYAIGDLLAM